MYDFNVASNPETPEVSTNVAYLRIRMKGQHAQGTESKGFWESRKKRGS